MGKQIPSIGRIVHYVAYGTPGGEYKPEHRAAIITAVPLVGAPTDDPRISLCVINPTGLFFNVSVTFDEAGKPGTWHWPEFVPPVD